MLAATAAIARSVDWKEWQRRRADASRRRGVSINLVTLISAALSSKLAAFIFSEHPASRHAGRADAMAHRPTIRSPANPHVATD